MEVEMEAMEGAATGVEEKEKKEAVRGMAKSGRWWKKTQTDKHSSIFKAKPLKTSWETKMAAKAKTAAAKGLQTEIIEKMAAEKAAKAERKKEQEQRRIENQRKAEIVQVITKTHKLKKTKKKQLRRIEKRDTVAAK